MEKEPAGWLSSCACKVVELLTICIERNSDIQMVVDSMPIILNVIEPLAGDPVPVGKTSRPFYFRNTHLFGSQIRYYVEHWILQPTH